MCFGPVASFTASSILAAIGAVILKNVRAKKELFFAAFPLLFAAQQFIEGLLWLAIKAGKPQALLQNLTFAYLTFAYSLWPILCPASVYAIEYDPKRKKVLSLLILLGVATSSFLFYFIATNPVQSVILKCSIRYETFVAGADLFIGFYLLVTLLPYFLSSHKAILFFGVPNLIFCAISY